MKRESHAMLAHQTKQVTFLLPKIGTQNETLDSDIEEGCLWPDAWTTVHYASSHVNRHF